MPKSIPIVFIVCAGVGHIKRGYESFTVECFETLKTNNYFKLYLLKGGGIKNENEIRIPCMQRNSKVSKFLHRITSKEPYYFEQLSFFWGMLFRIIKYKPAVIYYSDFILGTWLWHFRRILKFEYKLLFSNGAPNGPPFSRMDHVQQLLP